MSYQYYTWDGKKIKLVENSPSFCYGHCSIIKKEFTETVLISL